MSKYQDRFGQPLVLDRLLGQGGEGRVFEVKGQPTIAAKLYASPISAQRQRKIQLMPDLATADLLKVCAWPISPIVNSAKAVVGFTMPLVVLKDARPIHDLTNLKYRLQHYPKADWRFLIYAARNLAAAFATIHRHGQVIGDANPNNIYVARNTTVLIIDTDSFQFNVGREQFLCGVGTTEYTAPELQGVGVGGVALSENHDNFALATYIFQLIVGMGHYPGASVPMPGSPDVADLGEAIRLHHFAWGPRGPALGLRPPPKTPQLDIVPPDMGAMFEQAFGPSARRPSAGDWVQALGRLLAELKACSLNAAHVYYGHRCPWCALEREQRVYFKPVGPGAGSTPSTPTAVHASDSIDTQRILQQIRSVPAPSTPPINPPHLEKPVKRQPLVRLAFALSGVASLVLGFTLFFTGPSWVLGCLGLGVGALLMSRSDGRGDPDVLQKISAIDRQIATLLATYDGGRAQSNFQAVLKELEDIHLRLMDRPKLLTWRQDEARRIYAQHLVERELQRHVLTPGLIPGVGEKRVLLLRQRGIRTALDVDHRIRHVPGIGAKYADELLTWRRALERSVNPVAQLPAPLLEATRRQVDEDLKALTDKLIQGPARLTQAAADAERTYQSTRAELNLLLSQRSELLSQL
ncbi:hypothetical protein GCM10010842_35410 [Deinococcus daejeonensis]|uniref:Protein kinase domain-containing protein n=1 Tax=Deinococcus daejeonensis TaxID=1007098 RepID=A0ABQ2JHP3_9DEIO|nr:hypothetical protein GCM10010842_35410 [Deinococcus daejeonensis]